MSSEPRFDALQSFARIIYHLLTLEHHRPLEHDFLVPPKQLAVKLRSLRGDPLDNLEPTSDGRHEIDMLAYSRLDSESFVRSPSTAHRFPTPLTDYDLDHFMDAEYLLAGSDSLSMTLPLCPSQSGVFLQIRQRIVVPTFAMRSDFSDPLDASDPLVDHNFICTVLKRCFDRLKLHAECIIIALIYLERLMHPPTASLLLGIFLFGVHFFPLTFVGMFR